MERFRELADWNRIKSLSIQLPDLLGVEPEVAPPAPVSATRAPAGAQGAQSKCTKQMSLKHEPSTSAAKSLVGRTESTPNANMSDVSRSSSSNAASSSTRSSVQLNSSASKTSGNGNSKANNGNSGKERNIGCDKMPSSSMTGEEIELVTLSPKTGSGQHTKVLVGSTHDGPASSSFVPSTCPSTNVVIDHTAARSEQLASGRKQSAPNRGSRTDDRPSHQATGHLSWPSNLKRKFFGSKLNPPAAQSVESLSITAISGTGLTEQKALVIVVASASMAAFLTALILWLLIGMAQEPATIVQDGRQGYTAGPRVWPDGARPNNCAISRIDMCHRHRVGYSYLSLPNQLGQSDQAAINNELILYEKLVSVKCYSLLPDFLCSMYAPKCNATGHRVPICRTVCKEAKRKCAFFLKVFGLNWPIEVNCDSLPDSLDTDICVGSRKEQLLTRQAEACPDGFRCDNATRCTPYTWVCDGFIDCRDGSDERNCSSCGREQFHCGSATCINREDICDGIKDCPDGRDERLCLRLNEKMAPHPGQGRLEAWSAVSGNWTLVCGDKWDSDFMSNRACRKLGYREANSTWIRDESRPNTRDRLGAQGPQLEAKNFFYKGRARGCQGSTQLAVYLGCKNFECGRPASDISGPSARIVGGTESIPGQWPWLVGLHGGVDEIFFCGGVLISPTWVLSAAHCVGNQTSITGWSVQLGLTRRTASPLFVRKRKLAAIIKHPAFNAVNSYGNDIALLKLDQPVDFDEFLRPVCLPKDGLKLSPGTRCTVVGWGKSIHAEDADYLNVAHEVEVPLVHHSVCSRWYSLQDVPIGDTMLCAGYPEGRKDACQGDSGGPLLCKDGPGEPWYVAGIVSWGINCAQPNLPGIYTNVGMYKEWIRAVSTAHGEAIFE